MLISTITLPKYTSAQYRSFVLGVKAAPSVCWLNTSQKVYDSKGIKPGFSWGLSAEIYFAKNYALATGLSFIYQGGKLSYPDIIDGNRVTLERNYRIRYLEIPAVLKLKTNEIGKFRYYGQLGLGFGVRTKSMAKDEYRSGTNNVSTDYRVIDNSTNLFKTALIVGAGIEYPFDNNTAMIVGINFNNGLTDALKGDNVAEPSYEHEGRPNFVELHIGVMF